ncbi:ABC transporter permease [Streptomyces galbus]|uniref:Transport permease protein n=1 Tax=Streptomyces galbus TaxID=33898 RepID=A0A4U5X3Q9_STRGB|nr:ABC transporter permease [Streptomyces galbus]GHD24116.1 transport permease protein [Streptomyces galbus]
MSETPHDGRAPRVLPSSDAGLAPAELASKYGLSVSGARPPVPAYLRRLWDRRHFVLAFSSAKLAAQYSQARLGQLWQVATPLLNAAVYFMVFGLILGAGRGMPKDVYIPFLVTGVFVFTFTQSSVMSGVRAISGNLGLVRALHFPRAALPLSLCLQQLQQLLYSMIVLFLVVVGFGSYPDLSWALIPAVLALQFCFNSGLAMIVARAGAHTPDLAQLMPFVLRTWMYASGVMFSIPVFLADKPQWIANVLQWNPAALYMDLMRFALIEEYGAENLPDHAWAVAGGWAVFVALGGFLFFWQAEEKYGRG